MNYYDNISYAAERLHKTVVNTSKGVPIYIDSAAGGGVQFDPDEDEQPEYDAGYEFNCYSLETRERLKVDLSEIDLTPVKLGYVNFADFDALFFSRTPLRSWKQGLSVNNLVVNHYMERDDITVNFPIWELHNTILRRYPSYEESLDNKFLTAFCPNFAINRENNLYYKAIHVGEGKSLYEPFFYLEQHLNECLEGDYAD